MAELIANDLITYGQFKQWITITTEYTLLDYEAAFGEKSLKGISNAINIAQANFYDIRRCFQFVSLLKYTHSMNLLTLALFESPSMDDFLDGFIALQGKNWKEEDLNKIGRIAQEIIDDQNKELATIRLEKLL
jgi:hypothetical protein